MSEDFENDLPEENELDILKNRADQMGIKYHPAIGLEKLREKVNEKLALPEPEPGPVELKAPPTITAAPVDPKVTVRREANKLIRARIVCMNPAKSEWEGEIFTTGNMAVGTIRKFVPFNVPWHIPQMVMNMIEERKCQVFQTVTDPRSRQKSRQGRLIKEFNVEYLTPLTEKEIKELAQRQAMAAGTAEL